MATAVGEDRLDLWVIGAHGMLGSAIARSAAPHARLFPAPVIPWGTSADPLATLRAVADEFQAWRRAGGRWAVVWAAGTGVVASPRPLLETQRDVVVGLARSIADEAPPGGAFLFASSAAVYGAGAADPSDEESPAFPLSAYGELKLATERELTRILTGRVVPVIARIGTLYGPGQNLTKSQGLVAAMCREAIREGVIPLWAPLDTLRDYIHVDDAATACAGLVGRASTGELGEAALRVVASYRSTTIAELARTVQAVAHRRTHLLLAPGPATGNVHRQMLATRDDRLRRAPVMSLAAGVHSTYRDVLVRHAVSGG